MLDGTHPENGVKDGRGGRGKVGSRGDKGKTRKGSANLYKSHRKGNHKKKGGGGWGDMTGSQLGGVKTSDPKIRNHFGGKGFFFFWGKKKLG